MQKLQGANVDVPMAEQLLAIAYHSQLSSLACICERRLCETVQVASLCHQLCIQPCRGHHITADTAFTLPDAYTLSSCRADTDTCMPAASASASRCLQSFRLSASPKMQQSGRIASDREWCDSASRWSLWQARCSRQSSTMQ